MPVKEEPMERMGFTLPPKHAEAIRGFVERGDYGSEAEVLRDAVRQFLASKQVPAVQTDGNQKEGANA